MSKEVEIKENTKVAFDPPAEEIDENLIDIWDKPKEYDTKTRKKFLTLDVQLMKPIVPTEAYWYYHKPKLPCWVKAPEDIDPKAGAYGAKVMKFANCPESLRPIIPGFHGVKLVAGVKYVSMDNIMYNMRNPVICDIKLGTRAYDPFANRKKMDETINWFEKMPEFGFRVTGMRLWKDKNTKATKEKKDWGSTLVDWEKHIEGEFIGKYCSQMTEKQKVAMLKELEKLDDIWTKHGQKEVVVFSQSLIIAYDAAIAVDNAKPKEGDKDYDPHVLRAKLIDFNHCFHRKDHPEVEDGVLVGIRNVRRAFLKVIKGDTGKLGDGPRKD